MLPIEPEPRGPATIILGGLAGTAAGFLLAIAVSSLPQLFRLEDWGSVTLGLSLVAFPVFVLGGGFAGALVSRRSGGLPATIALVVSMVLFGTTVKATIRATPADPVSGSGCKGRPLETTFVGASTVQVYERSCPGDHRTVDVAIVPPGEVVDPTAPGNALDLELPASADARRIVAVSGDVSGSGLKIIYDSRARLIRRASRIGGLDIHVVRAGSDSTAP